MSMLLPNLASPHLQMLDWLLFPSMHSLRPYTIKAITVNLSGDPHKQHYKVGTAATNCYN